MKNPCYDERTKTDCAERCAECAASCQKWKAYEAARNTEYEARAIGAAAEASTYHLYYRKLKQSICDRSRVRKHDAQY